MEIIFLQTLVQVQFPEISKCGTYPGRGERCELPIQCAFLCSHSPAMLDISTHFQKMTHWQDDNQFPRLYLVL